jgi:uncharacterized protein YneF (UPF0154 family)
VLYIIILVQFAVIATLLAGFSTTYLSNDYFRIWVDSNFPGMSLLLTGQVVTLLVGMALGGTFLLIQQVKRGTGIEGNPVMTPAKGSSPFSTGELLPDQTQGNDMGAVRETPEHVLGELEKQDF